jgi:hypothetical protein
MTNAYQPFMAVRFDPDWGRTQSISTQDFPPKRALSTCPAGHNFESWQDAIGSPPCSPYEWPYNLQALRGTEDYDDILAWYCKRNPAVSRGDLDQLVAEVIHCVGDRRISVEIHHDMDTQERFPWFLVWGFAKEPSDDEDRVTDAFRDSWLASPLVHIVMVSFRSGSFENRHVSDWS